MSEPSDGTDGSNRITRLEHDGLAFDVHDDGPVDGDPVVLLHGFPEKATSWRSVAPLLHRAGLRTYAPDQRGYSWGARPRRRRDYRLDRLVGDVVALVEAIGRPVHLVGHDWGSVVGWALAGSRPDLVRSWTAVSVPHPAPFVRSWFTSNQALKSWYMALFNVPWLVEGVTARNPRLFERSLARTGMTPDEVARCRREVIDDGALRGGLMWYRALPLAGPAAVSGERVSVPTTMVWSDRDVAIGRTPVDRTPPWVEGPYELVVLEGVSHWIPTQAPEALAEAVLARTGSVTR